MRTEQATISGRHGAVRSGLTYLTGRELPVLGVLRTASGATAIRLRVELERLRGLKARLKG